MLLCYWWYLYKYCLSSESHTCNCHQLYGTNTMPCPLVTTCPRRWQLPNLPAEVEQSGFSTTTPSVLHTLLYFTFAIIVLISVFPVFNATTWPFLSAIRIFTPRSFVATLAGSWYGYVCLTICSWTAILMQTYMELLPKVSQYLQWHFMAPI